MIYNPLHNSYRRFCWPWWKHWLSPRTYGNAVKVFWQRGTRGWAYCDVWGVDNYMCDVLVPMLERLQQLKHGFPCPLDAVMDDCGNATDEEYARWHRTWEEQLDEMIAGFKAAKAILDGPPDQFFTKRSPEAIAADQVEADKYDAEHPGFYQWVSELDLDMDGLKKWEAEQEAIRLKGFSTFTKRFLSLWD